MDVNRMGPSGNTVFIAISADIFLSYYSMNSLYSSCLPYSCLRRYGGDIRVFEFREILLKYGCHSEHLLPKLTFGRGKGLVVTGIHLGSRHIDCNDSVVKDSAEPWSSKRRNTLFLSYFQKLFAHRVALAVDSLAIMVHGCPDKIGIGVYSGQDEISRSGLQFLSVLLLHRDACEICKVSISCSIYKHLSLKSFCAAFILNDDTPDMAVRRLNPRKI